MLRVYVIVCEKCGKKVEVWSETPPEYDKVKCFECHRKEAQHDSASE